MYSRLVTVTGEERGAPIQPQDDGSLVRPSRLMGYAGPADTSDDTTIEEGLTLREVLPQPAGWEYAER